MWCQRICLSVGYKLWPQLSRDLKNRMGGNFLGHLWQNECSQKILIVRKVAGRAGPMAKTAVFFCTFYYVCLLKNGKMGLFR